MRNHGRDLRTSPVWRTARAQKPGQSGKPAGADDRLRHGQPRACGRIPAAVQCTVFPARIFQYSARRPRRAALRAGHQADGRERRSRRHPISGRRPLQEAGRNLLDAIRRGADRDRARPAEGAAAHLGLPHSLIDRRGRRRAADLLGGARLCHAARIGARGAAVVRLGAAVGGSTARQDRCDAAAHRGRGDGSAGAGLSLLATRRRSRASALELAHHLLDGAGRRYPDQGTADPDVRGAHDSRRWPSWIAAPPGCGGCARSGASSGCWCW